MPTIGGENETPSLDAISLAAPVPFRLDGLAWLASLGWPRLDGVRRARAPADDTPPGNPIEGRRLAHTVCIACHYVETVDRGVSSAGAPAFQDMADNPAITAIGPRGFLRTPHETMPDLILAAAETDNVIAYILSLKQPDQKRAGPGRRIEARIDRQSAMTAFLVFCF